MKGRAKKRTEGLQQSVEISVLGDIKIIQNQQNKMFWIIINQQFGVNIDMIDKKEEEESVWRFSKLKKADNII